jgi:hypothetical protein
VIQEFNQKEGNTSMTDPRSTAPSRSLSILKVFLYILAGLILAGGLMIGVSLLTSASLAVANIVLPLQILAGEAIANIIAPYLSGFLISLGMFTLGLALILSALLYTAGRLVGQVASLEARLARLEARSAK